MRDIRDGQNIMVCALKLVELARGKDDITPREIQKALRVSRGTAYRYRQYLHDARGTYARDLRGRA